jgi:hypothetical protein
MPLVVLTQFILILEINFALGLSSGYLCPHSIFRLYILFSYGVCGKWKSTLHSMSNLFYTLFMITIKWGVTLSAPSMWRWRHRSPNIGNTANIYIILSPRKRIHNKLIIWNPKVTVSSVALTSRYNQNGFLQPNLKRWSALLWPWVQSLKISIHTQSLQETILLHNDHCKD